MATHVQSKKTHRLCKVRKPQNSLKALGAKSKTASCAYETRSHSKPQMSQCHDLYLAPSWGRQQLSSCSGIWYQSPRNQRSRWVVIHFCFLKNKYNTTHTYNYIYIILYNIIYIACAPGFSCSPQRLQHSSCNQEVHTLIVHKHSHSLDLWVSFPNMNGHAHSVSGLMWGGAHQHLDATFSRSLGKNGEKQFLLWAAKETWFISRFDSCIIRWIYVT